MSSKTDIEWTDATWNPVRGCTRVSEGCRNCYAEVMAARFSDPGQWGHGLAQRVTLPNGKKDHRWTGKIELVESALTLPMRWKKPRMIFVNSTSDLFHEDVPFEYIDRVFAVMALSPQHTFQLLTKRPERMRDYLGERAGDWQLHWPDAAVSVSASPFAAHVENMDFPLPNVWLGTSVEDQATADVRIPHLLATPAAVRFVSAEPLLGPVDLSGYLMDMDCNDGLDWVIVGGESGPGARPMLIDWARDLRDQCQAAGVAFFVKQMGGARKSAMPAIPDDLMIREYPDAR